MGQIQVLTSEQKIILARITKNEFLRENFYFTGGTALAEYYLGHRYSEDMDFFSEQKFDKQPIVSFFEDLSKEHHFELKSESIETVNIFYLYFSNKKTLKIDFNYYPFQRVEKSIFRNGIYIDSLLDIAINKLMMVVQRSDIKDFVDLYFLEPRFGVWDLIEGVELKFRQKLEPYLLGSDFLKIEDFDFLPKMIRQVSLEELKKFFRGKAKEVGQKAVE